MNMLTSLINEDYSPEYIDYLIEKDIDYNCEVGLYEKGFSKKVKPILNKYFEDYETNIGYNHWGNRDMIVTVYDRRYVALWSETEEDFNETVSVPFNYTY